MIGAVEGSTLLRMETEDLLVILTALTVITLMIVGPAYIQAASKRRKLEPLAEVLDGRQGEMTSRISPKLEGRFKGRRASFDLKSGGRSTPPQFSIQLACSNPLIFEIHREDWDTRISRKLGMLKDVEIGDREIDDKLFFRCREPGKLSRWMASREIRSAVLSLFFARDVDRLVLWMGKLEAIHFRYHATDLDPARVRSVLQEMEGLVRTLEAAV